MINPAMPPAVKKTKELPNVVSVKHIKNGETFKVTKQYYLTHTDTLEIA